MSVIQEHRTAPSSGAFRPSEATDECTPLYLLSAVVDSRLRLRRLGPRQHVPTPRNRTGRDRRDDSQSGDAANRSFADQ